MMLNERSIVDRIERAQGARPFCDCGRETTAVYRDGTVWLECPTMSEPAGSTVQRIWTLVTPRPHVREEIADLVAAQIAA